MEISVSTPDVVDSVTSVGNLVYHYAPLKADDAAKIAIVISVDAVSTKSTYGGKKYVFNVEAMLAHRISRYLGLITDSVIQRKEEGKPKSHDVYATEFDTETELV